MSNAIDTLREQITKGAHKGGHHPRCRTGMDKGCDCYARASAPARAALADVEELLQAAEALQPKPSVVTGVLLLAEPESDALRAAVRKVKGEE